MSIHDSENNIKLDLNLGRLRVAVIGDPHFVLSEHALASVSHLKIDQKGLLISTEPAFHPWAALKALVGDAKLNADVLICAGDLSTGGDRIALASGWDHLNALGDQLSSKFVACATGNHDVVSRSKMAEATSNIVRKLGDSRGLNEYLKTLAPPYPLVDLSSKTGVQADQFRTNYFGNNFVLKETSNCRIVVLNSCGEHSPDNIDYEKGSFPESTRRDLLKALEATESTKFNILVCHHPPMSHGHQGENNYDFITNGGQLLTALEEHGSWLVLHGHKHHSHLSYAQGGGRAPVVFAAASLGAYHEKAGMGFRNQFYIIDLEHSSDEDLLGTVRSWDWHHGIGYHPSTRKNGGIFDSCGFGNRQSPNQIASAIKEHCMKMPVLWSDILAVLPELKYVLPSEYALIESVLRCRYGVAVESDSEHNWTSLSKAVI